MPQLLYRLIQGKLIFPNYIWSMKIHLEHHFDSQAPFYYEKSILIQLVP